jgi:hypothetical protein
VKVACLQDVSRDRAAFVYGVLVSSKDGGYAWVVVSNRFVFAGQPGAGKSAAGSL